MRRYDPTPPWATFEIGIRADDGLVRRPFSDDLLSGDPIQGALGKMWLVQFHGWPAAQLAMHDDDEALIDNADDKDPAIWILKCKPSCWRLYFHIYRDAKRIVYLYAKCKKKWKRSGIDSANARRRLESIASGRAGIILFEFPAN